MLKFFFPSPQDYLRRYILFGRDGDLPRDNPRFLAALRDAATMKDCINPEAPLDFSHRFVDT